jgi:hypothetical protein
LLRLLSFTTRIQHTSQHQRARHEQRLFDELLAEIVRLLFADLDRPRNILLGSLQIIPLAGQRGQADQRMAVIKEIVARLGQDLVIELGSFKQLSL